MTHWWRWRRSSASGLSDYEPGRIYTSGLGPSIWEEDGMMRKIKLLVAVVTLMVTMSTAALAQSEG